MMVLMHVATGAAAGSLVRSRAAGAVLGLVLHAALDVAPHDDVRSQAFEIATGVGTVLLLARRFGPCAPETVGAAISAAPDLEHVLPLPRVRGRKLFPTHRWPLGHADRRRVPVAAQLVCATAILGLLVRRAHDGVASSLRK